MTALLQAIYQVHLDLEIKVTPMWRQLIGRASQYKQILQNALLNCLQISFMDLVNDLRL